MERGILKAPHKASLFWEMTQERELFEDKEKYNTLLKELKDDDELRVDLKRNKELYQRHKLTGRERLILIHTRLKTTGTELNNLNNHPIWSDYTTHSGYVLIHNGVVYDGYIKKYPYLAQVDSEDILASIETYGISKGLQKVSGSMAIAFKRMIEDTLYIYRNSNPFDIVYLPKEKLLVGSSDDRYIRRDDIDLSKPDLNKILIENTFRTVTVPADMLYSINLKKPDIKWEEKIDVPLVGSGKNTNNFERQSAIDFNEKYIGDGKGYHGYY